MLASERVIMTPSYLQVSKTHGPMCRSFVTSSIAATDPLVLPSVKRLPYVEDGGYTL